MIERYARTRGERLFHADEGGYLILQDSARGHFPVHMHAHDSSPDVVVLRPRWSTRFAHPERNSQFRITDDADFDAFGQFVDSSLASAAASFEGAWLQISA